MKFTGNIWKVLGVLALLLFGYLFLKVVIYLIISLVLFLLGYPVTHRLEKIKFGKFRLPDSIAALCTLILFIGIITSLFMLIIPPLADQLNFISGLNFYDVLHNLLNQYPGIKSLLLKFGNENDLKESASAHLAQLINSSTISSAVNNLFSYLGTITGGTLCVLFITFFLLKDENLVRQSLITLTPSGMEKEMRDILRTSKKMLSKYFTALFLDMFIVGILVMACMSFFGISNALLIACVAALLNVIPYIGSVITMIIAIFLGVSSCISSGNYDMIGPTVNTIFFCLLSINLIDGFLIQPFLFSSSVKAHPLEIFLVTLMAASIGGVPGMIVALPVYTLIRIVAKEFLTHLKFFRKISETIDE